MCSLAFDVPGSSPTAMAGKQAYLASGTARLAYETGALVVPVLTDDSRPLPEGRVLAPVDASKYGGWQQIHDRLAQLWGDIFLQMPQLMEPTGFQALIWREDAVLSAAD